MARIIKLSTTKVTTQYGEKDKFLVTIEQDGKQIVADSFCGKWNNDWVEGLELEIKPTQWKSREYNGKKYWSIMAPPEAKGNFVNPQEIAELKKMVEGQEAIINEMARFMGKYKPMLESLAKQSPAQALGLGGVEEAVQLDEEVPVVESAPAEDEIRLEDVPF